jgi:hypothetical protein
MWGPEETSGWWRKAVERVRGVQEVAGFSSKGGCCKLSMFIENRKMHVCLSSSSLQALEDKEEEGLL